MQTVVEKEISVLTLRDKVIYWFNFFLERWKSISVVCIIAACLGIVYAKLIEKPLYTAELTFVCEEEGGGLSGYAGIASQFGIDVGGSGSAFDSENLMELFKSQKIVQKTLLTNATINNKKTLLINTFISTYGLNKTWDKKPECKTFFQNENEPYGNRSRDSILLLVSNKIIKKQLAVDKVDPKINKVFVRLSNQNEEFCKVFIEVLTNNIIEYYTDYKTKKSKSNIEVLQLQADSVRKQMFGGMESIASHRDLNVNPLRQSMNIPAQKTQVNVSTNAAIYSEIVKNIEFAKIAFQKQSPLIHLVDTPILPLEKTKMGTIKSVLLFGIIGFIIVAFFHIVKLALSKPN